MASYNRVILMGNLTRDPELRYTASGTPVCEIGLAVNDRRRTPEGEWVDETTFVDVTLWAKTAETCNQYLTKGSSVLLEGRLKLDSWEQEGQKRSKLRVVCERMQMIGGRSSQGGGGGSRSSDSGYDDSYSQAPPSRSTQSQAPSDDGIPF